MRLVVDTNVLISALLSAASLPAQIIVLWRAGRFDLLTAAEQLDEIGRVTRYPKIRERLHPAVAGRLVNDLRALAVMLDGLPVIEASPDPDDNYLLAMAVAGSADFLITGDKRDLLGLGVYQGTKILTVRDFLTQHGTATMTDQSLTTNPGMTIRSIEDADCLMALIRGSAAHVHDWVTIRARDSDPLQMLRHMKFDQIGRHPIEDRCLNLVEQINQTWTYAVAVAAARQLLLLHPEAGGFHLAPGAHMARELDIMSEVPGLVGAETFAAVDPRNNNKLAGDLAKMALRSETHRYVFFLSSKLRVTARQPRLERDGVQVWSVDV